MIQGDERNQAYNEKTAWKHITKLISRGIHISQNSLESFIIMEFLREYDGYEEIVSAFKTIEESEAKEKEGKAKKEK